MGHPGQPGIPDRHLGPHPGRVHELGQPDLDASFRYQDGQLGTGHVHGGQQLVSDFPAYQFKDVNNPTTVRFTLTSSQLAARTVRIGITAAYAGAGPDHAQQLDVPGPGASSQPNWRLTIGTYRGNNALYTYNVPASAFVAGSNTMAITVISGSGALGD